jgi:hypothetical protein
VLVTHDIHEIEVPDQLLERDVLHLPGPAVLVSSSGKIDVADQSGSPGLVAPTCSVQARRSLLLDHVVSTGRAPLRKHFRRPRRRKSRLVEHA